MGESREGGGRRLQPTTANLIAELHDIYEQAEIWPSFVMVLPEGNNIWKVVEGQWGEEEPSVEYVWWDGENLEFADEY